jgi:preprotein translocase subunit YajC
MGMTGSAHAMASLVLVQAQPPMGGSRGLTVMMIYLIGFGLIFWFLILRPQRRMQQRHQQMVSALKRGDEVITEGGIIGSVVHIADDRVTIKTAENTRIVVARPKIARVMSAPEEEK